MTSPEDRELKQAGCLGCLGILLLTVVVLGVAAKLFWLIVR